MADQDRADLDFLRELVRRTDTNSDVRGRDIARDFGGDKAAIEGVIRRLERRGLIERLPYPPRLGDGPDDAPLAVTPDGYRRLNQGAE